MGQGRQVAGIKRARARKKMPGLYGRSFRSGAHPIGGNQHTPINRHAKENCPKKHETKRRTLIIKDAVGVPDVWVGEEKGEPITTWVTRESLSQLSFPLRLRTNDLFPKNCLKRQYEAHDSLDDGKGENKNCQGLWPNASVRNCAGAHKGEIDIQ
jgi:hypothetical protein